MGELSSRGSSQSQGKGSGENHALVVVSRCGRTYLDICGHKSPWGRRQRRLFQRCMSGVELAFIRGQRVRILTLTSSPSSVDLHRHWTMFVRRVRRAYGLFEYLAVKEFTSSGLVHIHALFVGSYLPFSWVKETWFELHKAKDVFIQAFRGSKKRMGAYLCKYVAKDKTSNRYWWSWRWVYRGFVSEWKLIVKAYGKNSVRTWNKLLRGHFIALGTMWVLRPPWVEQRKLWDFSLTPGY